MSRATSVLERLRGHTRRPDLSGYKIDPDTVYDLISSARRRHAVMCIAGNDEPIDLSNLAEALAFVECADVETPDELGWEDRKRVYISLHQTHLPKLERNGIITHDRNNDIELTPLGDQLARVVREFEAIVGGDWA